MINVYKFIQSHTCTIVKSMNEAEKIYLLNTGYYLSIQDAKAAQIEQLTSTIADHKLVCKNLEQEIEIVRNF